MLARSVPAFSMRAVVALPAVESSGVASRAIRSPGAGWLCLDDSGAKRSAPTARSEDRAAARLRAFGDPICLPAVPARSLVRLWPAVARPVSTKRELSFLFRETFFEPVIRAVPAEEVLAVEVLAADVAESSAGAPLPAEELAADSRPSSAGDSEDDADDVLGVVAGAGAVGAGSGLAAGTVAGGSGAGGGAGVGGAGGGGGAAGGAGVARRGSRVSGST